MKSAAEAVDTSIIERTDSFWSQVGPVFFLALIFMLNFISRIILSPLLPTVEKELAISHKQAGLLFFLISAGYLSGLLTSGFVSSHSTHRRTILISSAGVGISLLSVSLVTEMWAIRLGLVALGIASGFYMPSAIATITSLIHRRHWGKAIAIHELAPNLAFFLGPFVAELFLRWASWRTALGFLGSLSLIACAAFSRFGRGGNFAGESPASGAFGALIRLPTFWLMILLFGLGVSSTIGIYAMLPLFLVIERHLEPTWANTLVAFSRVHGPILGMLGGWASDKLGAKPTIVISMIFTGTLTLLLGVLSNVWLGAAVLLQPLLAVWFFPAAFAAVAMIAPAGSRNLAVSFTVPFGFVIGGGAIPTFIGVMGDTGSFAFGFIVTGALIGAGALLSL
ncbi:MAG TPA: MFS transporter, partial [Acidobacteriota bacterium]|nr:MFS transporter [Acidobacteriota bacterium]